MTKPQPVQVPVRFALKDSDLHSDTWRGLKQHLAERLAFWRGQNDGEHNDATKTALIRGRIAMLKDLLALDPKLNPPPD